MISPIIHAITEIVSVAVLVIMNMILLLLDTLERLREGWKQLEEATSKIWNAIKSSILTIIRAIQTGIDTVIGKIQNSWKKHMDIREKYHITDL